MLMLGEQDNLRSGCVTRHSRTGALDNGQPAARRPHEGSFGTDIVRIDDSYSNNPGSSRGVNRQSHWLLLRCVPSISPAQFLAFQYGIATAAG